MPPVFSGHPFSSIPSVLRVCVCVWRYFPFPFFVFVAVGKEADVEEYRRKHKEYLQQTLGEAAVKELEANARQQASVQETGEHAGSNTLATPLNLSVSFPILLCDWERHLATVSHSMDGACCHDISAARCWYIQSVQQAKIIYCMVSYRKIAILRPGRLFISTGVGRPALKGDATKKREALKFSMSNHGLGIVEKDATHLSKDWKEMKNEEKNLQK